MIRKHSKDSNRGGKTDEPGEHDCGAEVVENHAYERNGDDASKWQRDVEEGVYLNGLFIAADKILVLRSDRRDKIVDASHLDDCKQRNENEPP